MSPSADAAKAPISASAAPASPHPAPSAAEAAAREPAFSPIGARLDALGGSWRLWRLIALISLGGFFEFYDLMMTAYVSPGLERAGIFHRGAAGLFGQSDQAAFASATFLGLFIGTILFARVADRFGRRAIFTVSLVWYALATLAMSTCHTALGLDAWRLVSGIGIGVELVTIDAFVGELAPARLRGRAFAVNQAIQFLAVPAVAVAAWLLVPRTPFGIAGWRWVMLLGAAGAVVVWAIRARLPESPRWLERRGRIAEAEAILDRLETGRRSRPSRRGAKTFAAPPPGAQPGRLAEAFAPPFRRRTLMLIVFNIAQAIGFYGFGNWAPSLIAAQGHSVTHSLAYASAIAAAYPLAPLLCALVADRFERKHLIIAAAIVTAITGVAFAGQADAWAIVALGVLLTASNNLLSFAYHAYQTELYPTRIRASAVGFVYAWSRLSTVISSFAVAALLTGFGSIGVFVFIAGAMAVVVLAVGLFGPRTRGRSLEAAAH
jgi:putative MFS transporter